MSSPATATATATATASTTIANASGKRERAEGTEQSSINKKTKAAVYVKEYGNELLKRLRECDFSCFVDNCDTVKEAEEWAKLQGDFTKLTRVSLELVKRGRKRYPPSNIGLLSDIITEALEDTESFFDTDDNEHECMHVTLGKLCADEEFTSKLTKIIKDAIYEDLDRPDDDKEDDGK